jgi:hypothetical protein
LIDEEQARRMRASSSNETESSTQGVVLVKASELKPQPINWIWNGWLASGKFHLIGGIAGTGKTSIALALASTITRGGLFPNGANSEFGEVVMWTGEDDPADTLTPRLMAMGADLEKVHFVCGFNSFGKERPFNPATDLDELKVTLEGLSNLRLLILDPIVAVVTKDGNKNSELINKAKGLIYSYIKDTGKNPKEELATEKPENTLTKSVLYHAFGDDDKATKLTDKLKDESIDKCIKNVLKNKEFIKNKEHYVINTKQIIKVINKCDERIKSICCGYCLKCKKLETIIKHKCKYL